MTETTPKEPSDLTRQIAELVAERNQLLTRLAELGNERDDYRQLAQHQADELSQLSAEYDDLQATADDYDQLFDMMRKRLTETANALKGTPPANVLHDWSDLADVATKIIAQRDEFRAEADSLRLQELARSVGSTRISTVFERIADVMTERDALRAALPPPLHGERPDEDLLDTLNTRPDPEVAQELLRRWSVRVEILKDETDRLRDRLEDVLLVLTAEEADYDEWTSLLGRVRDTLNAERTTVHEH